MPLSLTTSGAWNCNGAVQTSVTDANGSSASWTFNDPNFWRPTATTDPTHAVTDLSYFTSPSTGNESTLNFNGNASTVALRTTLDGLGRTHVNQQLQSPGATNYDSVEVDYDSLGRPSRATVPYTGTAGQTNSTAPATKTTYDALGRPLTVTDGGGGVTTYTYTQNDVLIAIGPAPAGENLKRRQLEYDGLGRSTSVCEITAQTGAGNCGQTVAQTGYLTKYTYDALNDLLTVTQNAQSTSSQERSFTYDGLGRLTSQATPETAGKSVTYTYDSDTTCGTSRGDLMKRVDAANNVTCYAYDALHRVTSVTYPSGPNASVTPAKTFVYDAATVDGFAMANAKGLLAEAYTGPSSGKLTDEGFSYSARGEVTDSYEKTPHSGGTYGTYYHISASYWANGLLNTLNSNFTGMPTWTYTPDGEGRMNALLASGNQNALTGTNYNEFGQATGLTFGGASDVFGYDANTGRMTQYVFTTEYQGSLSGTLTWNPNGTLKQLAITDPFQASDNQTCNNSYDDLSRLLTNNCGSVWNQAFSYDAFGNIAFTGTASFQPTYNSATNRYNTLPASTPAYDANGNLTNYDGVTYTWDAEGKTSATSNPETIAYDALGRLVEQYAAGSPIPTSDWVFAPGGVKLNITPSTAFAGVEARLQLPAGVAVDYEATPSGASNGPGLYFHPDWLGSTRFLTDGTAGYVGAEIAVSPFGRQYIGNGDNSLFTGAGEPDAIAGWTFPARDLLPDQGRWLSPDPAGLTAADPTNPQTWNRYAYVANNPLSNVDPSGMASCTSTDNCGLFVGSAPGPASWNDPRFSAYGGPGGQYTSLGQLTASATPTGWNDGWLYGNSNLSSVTFSAEGLALAPNSDPLPGGSQTAGNCSPGMLGTAIGFAATGTIYSFTLTTNAPTKLLTGEIGSLFGPVGAIVGSAAGGMFGVGGNLSYVPSTGSLYAGPVGSFGIGWNGGSGWSANAVHVPSSQNPNSIASGWSSSLTYQPSWFLGSTVTKSSGSPPVTGPSIGTRVPFSVSKGYNFCLRHCGC